VRVCYRLRTGIQLPPGKAAERSSRESTWGHERRAREPGQTPIVKRTSNAAESAAAPAPDPLDQLKKLAELRDSDAISPIEYEEHKTKLLAKLARDIEE